MFKKAALVLLAIVAVLAIVVQTRPSTYQVTRSTQVDAPPAMAFAQVNDFHKWQDWSPWEKRDATMTKSYSGAPTGTGASYFWSGKGDVGEGRMTITDSRPSEQIAIKLEFIKPFAAECVTTFAFVPNGPTTQVTWTMSGDNNFLSKAFSLVNDMDKMIGKDFDQGLAALKVQAETANKVHAAEVAAALAAAQAPAPAPDPAPVEPNGEPIPVNAK